MLNDLLLVNCGCSLETLETRKATAKAVMLPATGVKSLRVLLLVTTPTTGGNLFRPPRAVAVLRPKSPPCEGGDLKTSSPLNKGEWALARGGRFEGIRFVTPYSSHC